MKILFSRWCRASLIAVCRVPPLQTASDQSVLTGQELCVPHTAGQMSASKSGTPEKKEAAHARRLASARFDGLACRKNCLIIDMKMFFWRGGVLKKKSRIPASEGYACTVVAIIYLALPSLPPAIPTLREKSVKKKYEDMGRRWSEPGPMWENDDIITYSLIAWFVNLSQSSAAARHIGISLLSNVTIPDREESGICIVKIFHDLICVYEEVNVCVAMHVLISFFIPA